ncbi:helix-turn-helix domain-containing protein [Vogesella facilis]|uniref:Helix-turn-helix domain-containing protein n=1 Tax=Vogesella facilis TaxID=1655232 RepID=A0ABV7RK82_9NEIS
MEKQYRSDSLTPNLDAIAAYRDFVSTEEAAALLNRKPQTLRKWACSDKGPIRPVRIYGRLMWLVKEIVALLSGGMPGTNPACS